MQISREFSRTHALEREKLPACFPLAQHSAPLSSIRSDISVTRRRAYGKKRNWMRNYSIILFSVLSERGKKLELLPEIYQTEISNSCAVRRCNPHFKFVAKLVHTSYLLDTKQVLCASILPTSPSSRPITYNEHKRNLIISFGSLIKYSQKD